MFGFNKLTEAGNEKGPDVSIGALSVWSKEQDLVLFFFLFLHFFAGLLIDNFHR